MLHGAAEGRLEVRAEGDGTRVISGRFPYNTTATLAEGGRGRLARRETFAPRAFASRVSADGEDIHLLSGHDFQRPLASRNAGTLTITDTEDGLDFEARISPTVAETTHGRDALALIDAGLSVGLSPGFRLANREGAESVTRANDAVTRTVNAADLFELSVVTRPAFSQAQVEARSWEAEHLGIPKSQPAAWRWR